MNEPQSIDQVLDNLTFEVLKWNYGASSAETKMEQHKAKAAIEAMVREIIGEDEAFYESDGENLRNIKVLINDRKQGARLRASKYNLKLEKE